MKKKYIVRLSDSERNVLGDGVKRAHILFMSDTNGPAWTDERAADFAEVSLRTVSRGATKGQLFKNLKENPLPEDAIGKLYGSEPITNDAAARAMQQREQRKGYEINGVHPKANSSSGRPFQMKCKRCEAILLVIPKWCIETWVVFFKHGNADESQNCQTYKNQIESKDYRIAAKKFASEFRTPPKNWLPAMKHCAAEVSEWLDKLG